jgi:hypothetical protein
MVSRVSKVSETRRYNKSSHFTRANVNINFAEADKLTGTEFLEQENIMDYSLLVGVHFRDRRDRLLTGGLLNIQTNLMFFR